MRSAAEYDKKQIMEPNVRYRGRNATQEEVAFIKKTIADNPGISRRALSRTLCEAWGWVQPNGALRDMVCRGYLLALHRAGHIELPEVKCRPHNPPATRKAPKRVKIDQSPIRTTVGRLQPLTIRQVRRTDKEQECNGLIEQYHYLGYVQPVGEHLKYIVSWQERPIACFTWSSAPRHIGCRDRYIGWDKDQRAENLRFMAYNSRFLIMPWVEVRHLASCLLGKMVKKIAEDWQQVYGHRIYYLETFVDTERFKGTCYRAANWRYLGLTTGRGKDDNTHKVNRSLKAVWGYALDKEFRTLLCAR